LLLLPGFITDAVGLLLLVPAVRGWVGGGFQRFAQNRPAKSPGVVDLEPDQWNQVQDRQIGDPGRPRDPN
jgi:UPF0716 family protein affecting phage T7 exclusion